MSKDDYHVIVFRILQYLYVCLKNDNKVDADMLKYNSELINANNENYWRFIINNMYKRGYIEGIAFVRVDTSVHPLPVKLERMSITPEGIEYFFDNKFLQKVRRVIRDLPISI